MTKSAKSWRRKMAHPRYTGKEEDMREKASTITSRDDGHPQEQPQKNGFERSTGRVEENKDTFTK